MRPTSVAVPPDTGKKCYREPGEPRDERPTPKIPEFWTGGPEEAAAYLSAVRENPRIADPEANTIESPLAYIQRLAEIVQGGPLGKAAKRFPPKPRLNREYTGPREPVQEHGLSFEDRTDEIYERQPGEEG